MTLDEIRVLALSEGKNQKSVDLYVEKAKNFVKQHSISSITVPRLLADQLIEKLDKLKIPAYYVAADFDEATISLARTYTDLYNNELRR